MISRYNKSIYRKRHEDIIKALDKCKKSKLIEGFHERPTVKGVNIHSFGLSLKNTQDSSVIYFLHSKKPYDFHLIENKSHELRVLLGNQVVPNKIYKFVSDIVMPMKLGYENEEIFFQSFLEAKRRFADIQISLIHADSRDDKTGVDFWIHLGEAKIPLQVKYYHRLQNKHKKRYDNIPSFVFKHKEFTKSKDDYRKLYQDIELIAKEYLKGIILHL